MSCNIGDVAQMIWQRPWAALYANVFASLMIVHFHDILSLALYSGGMAEWSIATVLKTVDREVRGFESLSLRPAIKS